MVTALAHVIVTEGSIDEAFIRARCDWDEYLAYADFAADPKHSPEATEALTGVPAGELRKAARLSPLPAATARSITGWASPSIPRARPR